MIVVQIWTIPRLIYIPIILALLVGALYCQRARLRDFFVRFDKIGSDLAFGFIFAIFLCTIEWTLIGLSKHQYPALRWDSLLLVPVGVILAGWRAGVYEELMFRAFGMGYLNLMTKRIWISNLMQAVLFCVAHAGRDGLWGSFGEPPLSRLVMALVFGFITIWRGSIIPVMVMHSFSNSFGAATLPPMEMFEKAINSWWPT